MTDAPESSRVVVVGGGLAGLTAALDLADGGAQVTLIEQRPYPGGKAFSFTDPATGVELDNGQHILLRCCTAYLAFLDRLGLHDHFWIQDRLRVPVLDPANGRMSEIAATSYLPAPLHLTPSVLRFGHLSWREKLALGRALWPLSRLSKSERNGLDGQSFADWLRAHGQSDAVIGRFWDLIVLPTCNDRAEYVSARQAIMVFQVGFLRDVHAAEIGVARLGLSTVADAALERLRAAGGAAQLGRQVETLATDGENVSGVELRDGTTITTDAVVLALPPNHARAVLPDAWRDRAGFAALAQFQYAPIVNVYLQWDRPVMEESFTAVLDPAVQYVFNRSRIFGWPDPEQWIDCSLSGAHTEAAQPQATIIAAATAGIRRAFPDAHDAQVLQTRVVKEQEATFRPLPGSAAYRLGPVTPAPTLFLAGAWTDTDWPATMESAVRSGHAAARACLTSLRSAVAIQTS